MVNTVGSYRNKHWTRRWSAVKEHLAITPEQRSVIIGSLLGDGTMRLGRKAANANFKVEHGLAQKAYVAWKYEKLKSLVHTEPKLSYRYRESGERYPKSWWFRTLRHPLFTEVYDRFYERDGYRTGKKIIPQNIAFDLDAQALAVWIMDDGSYSKGAMSISTYSFAESDIHLLQQALHEAFRIKAGYHSDRDKGFRMHLNTRETKCLVHAIHPYIIPSMNYKIGVL